MTVEDIGAFEKLRVSVATYNQVIFPHLDSGKMMLALERKATVLRNGSVNVQAQPFGGGVRIRNATSLERIIGEIQFDSERSKKEKDFRILIPPSKWGVVKEYCLEHLGDPDDVALESTPDRELIEEFEETIHVDLHQHQYMVRSMGFVTEDQPVWTENWYARGQFTVRIYRVFQVHIIDAELSKTMLAASQEFSDRDLRESVLRDFRSGGNGHASSMLTLPLDVVRKSYLALPPEKRYGKLEIENHKLDESVLAVLMDVDVPQYQRP